MKLVLPKTTALAPLLPSAAIHSWYFDRLQRLIKAMADSMELHICAAWKDETPEIGFARDEIAAPIRLKRAMNKWGKQWTSKFDRMSAEISKKFADKSQKHTQTATQAILKKAGFTVEFQATPAAIEAYRTVIAQNVGLIKNLPREYLDGIQGAVWSSVMKGQDLGALTRELRTRYDMSVRRAALVARDQTRKATALMENVRRQELGITTAVWLHSHAVRYPRPSHKAFSGKVYELKKGAYLDGKWVWPGSEINCRCLSRAIIPGINDQKIQKIQKREYSRTP